MTPCLAQGACAAGGAGAAMAAALHFFAASQCLVQEPWLRTAAPLNGSHFDVVVVGGGTAGATVAARLAAAGSFSVLLLEAGPDPPQDSIIPTFFNSLKGSRYDWNFSSIPEDVSGQGLANRQQKQPRGRMLGGSGSMNNMVYSRGFPADYDEWAAIAGSTWNWTNVLDYFKKTERVTDERILRNEELLKYHGLNGDIEVAGFDETSHETQKFLEIFKEIGFPIVDDMTHPHRIGAGRFSHTIKNGQRASSLTSLLNHVKSDNITVIKNALATQVLFENGTAVGVKVLLESDNEEYYFYADKEVVLSAGTYNTAKLLLLSGVGPKEHLEEMGIELVKDLPVGENLHDHVMYLNYIAAENGTCATDERKQYMDLITYLYDRSGPIGRSESMGALLSMNCSDQDTPDFAFYPTCTPMNSSFYEGCISVLGFREEVCSQLHEENKNNELLAIAVVLLKPKSRGHVRLRSTDPLDDPLIYSGTFRDEQDLEHFPKALHVVEALADTSYLKSKGGRVLRFNLEVCKGLEGVPLVQCEAKAMATSAWHAVGTAALGTVVDEHLKVIGVKGLRVVDASVMPNVVRGNTNAPVVMIAEKAADFIKSSYGAE